jgi:hypothetical protein
MNLHPLRLALVTAFAFSTAASLAAKDISKRPPIHQLKSTPAS